MVYDEIKEKVIKLCNEVFEDSDIDADMIEYVDFSDDLGMDSIKFISLIVEIESRLNIIIPDDYLLIDYFNNIDNIMQIVMSEINKTGDVKNDKALKDATLCF